MLEVLASIDRDNFGLIYEPANLMLCGEPYGTETLQQLRPHLMNVYVQNHVLDLEGREMVNTYCLGERRFHDLALWEKGGVDFQVVFDALAAIDYRGHFTIHQAQGIETVAEAREFADRCARFVQNRS